MKKFEIVVNINMNIFKPLKTSHKVMLLGCGSYKFMKFAVRPRGLDAGETPRAATSCGFQIQNLGACALTTTE
jgi:hypothetical protein